jgi:hypothetical protein
MAKQKEISTLVGIAVIIVITFVVFGAAVIYQNFTLQQMLSSFLQASSQACPQTTK